MKIKIKALHFMRHISKLFVIHPFTTILCLLAISYFGATILIMIFEKVQLTQAATLIMPAFLGELGNVETNSFITKISILTALLISVAFLAVITAKITTIFIEFCLKGVSILKKVRFSNHIIICGWNFQGEKIVNDLLNNGSMRHREVVVLANSSKRPSKNEHADFVMGDPTQDEALIRAGVKNADSVIVLTDLTKQANEADAEALMIVLAVESINQNVHTSIYLHKSA
jgi:voltage-gated potassium channel